MELLPSAHVDTFCRDRLPPADQWPEFLFGPPVPDYPGQLNCATVLLDETIATHGGGRPCLHAKGSPTWTYDDLKATANRIAHVLVEDRGLVPGNRVLLRGPNTPWLAACWFGVLKAGGVVVATMPLLRTHELQVIDEIADPDLALVDHRFLQAMDGVEVPVVPFGGDTEDDLTRLAATRPAGFTDVLTSADDVALLAFTSGTTGRPKCAMHFHRDVLAMADTFSALVLQPSPDDVFTGTPPIAFTFGLGGDLVFPLRAGASALMIEKASPPELAALIEEFSVTTLFTAPTAYKAMLAAGARLSTLHSAVSAGEHLAASVWQAFHEATGVKIIDGIGSTEMLHIFIASSGDEIRPGSTGRAVPGYVAAIVDDEGREVAPGEPGRLAVKGPTGCRYLADPRQQVYVQHGWNITGDTYRRDDDGYFWYLARSDDMIISSGYNIAAPEVEEAVLKHPDVAECAVIGWPDEQRGMLVKAYVVLADGVAADPELVPKLQDFVKAEIAPYKYPRAIEFVTELPRTQTGKLQRFKLRETTPEA
ncbi:MAG TPA: AMP-binding protein [Marmoricola sp.]|nr:AMP-binding protein [Marmoricola sp.]